MNKVILTGNVVSDPELNITKTGTPVISFPIAVQRNYKDKAGKYGVDFIKCVAWQSTAEFIAKNFKKGQRIEVIGEWQQREYITKDGAKRYADECMIKEAYFGGAKTSITAKEQQDITPTAAYAQSDIEPQAMSSDDDLPF